MVSKIVELKLKRCPANLKICDRNHIWAHKIFFLQLMAHIFWSKYHILFFFFTMFSFFVINATQKSLISIYLPCFTYFLHSKLPLSLFFQTFTVIFHINTMVCFCLFFLSPLVFSSKSGGNSSSSVEDEVSASIRPLISSAGEGIAQGERAVSSQSA